MSRMGSKISPVNAKILHKSAPQNANKQNQKRKCGQDKQERALQNLLLRSKKCQVSLVYCWAVQP
ncbi:hypothetical protein [Helicobacter sp. T3_23-1056]